MVKAGDTMWRYQFDGEIPVLTEWVVRKCRIIKKSDDREFVKVLLGRADGSMPNAELIGEKGDGAARAGIMFDTRGRLIGTPDEDLGFRRRKGQALAAAERALAREIRFRKMQLRSLSIKKDGRAGRRPPTLKEDGRKKPRKRIVQKALKLAGIRLAAVRKMAEELEE